MPLQATSGAASYDAFGGGAPAGPATYIEDVFSTWLYTGTGATLPIVNGIDLSTKGGLVWIKSRSNAESHALYDTINGINKHLISNSAAGIGTYTGDFTAFNTNGFTLGPPTVGTELNTDGYKQVSWTFRKQPKFFDIVSINNSTTTYNHNLGSTPGCIMVKCTSASGANWVVYHRSLSSPTSQYINLNTTGAASTYGAGTWSVSSTQFSVDPTLWANGTTGIAYLFAHDAGGFGLTGTDNVISCGGFTANGNNTITLGYEPQWVMVRRVSSAGNDWEIYDTMRGCSLTGSKVLVANSSAAENVGGTIYPTATGFYISSFGSGDIIYIAIRRGPMAVPTTGTSVFSPNISSGATGTAITTNFPVDFQLYRYRTGIDYWFDVDRLRGVNSTTTANATPWLDTVASSAEVTNTTVSRNWGNTGFQVPAAVNSVSSVFYSFQRAPSFFDEVCYTGTGAGAALVSNNLQAVPEFAICKRRDSSANWIVYHKDLTIAGTLLLNTSAADSTANQANGFIFPYNPPLDFRMEVYQGASGVSAVNASGGTYVMYLFATCLGVSKVGSYTGTGATQTISCGFTGGSRLVLIKRTDSTGNWVLWDSARGMVAGTDPRLALNSTAAEVNANWVYTTSGGFQIVTSDPDVNASGGSYIFLSVA